ncbi:hypothetical protein N9937_00540 [bacterium]|nr:hypothetical protein [bacterium]
MQKIDLDVRSEIEFTLDGKTYRGKRPSVKQYRDGILERIQKFKNVKDGGDVTKEQVQEMVEVLACSFEPFTVEVAESLSFEQMQIVMETLFGSGKNDSSPTP